MSSLVEALQKRRQQSSQGMEWSLKASDLTMPVLANRAYVMNIPVICVSADQTGAKFKAVGVPYVETQESGDGPQDQNVQTQESHSP